MYYIFVHVCVRKCVCIIHLCMYVCLYIAYASITFYMNVCVFEILFIYHVHICIHRTPYACICVCMCVRELVCYFYFLLSVSITSTARLCRYEYNTWQNLRRTCMWCNNVAQKASFMLTLARKEMTLLSTVLLFLTS